MMEKYKILECLGRGALGRTYIVNSPEKEKASKDVEICKSVLTKVECVDDYDATLIDREVQKILPLTKHKYIAPYEGYFQHYDAEEQTYYACIVTEYYKTGTLVDVFNQQRSKESPIADAIFKKWTGQLIEAIHYLHGKEVIHRNVKPTNIFLNYNLDTILGDFGFKTSVQKAAKRKRTAASLVVWRAPELDTQPCTKASDIWSLGCVLLALVASCNTTERELYDAMIAIRENPKSLKSDMSWVLTKGTRETRPVIESMLRPDPDSRPTTLDLIESDFVQSSLKLSKSVLYTGGDASPGARAGLSSATKPKTTKRIPSDIEGILGFLQEFKTRLPCVVSGLEAFAQRAKKDGDPDVVSADSTVQIVNDLMEDYMSDIFAQRAGIMALNEILKLSDEDDALIYQPTVVGTVLKSTAAHMSDERNLTTCMSLLALLCEKNETCCSVVGSLGGISHMLDVLKNHTDSRSTMAATCSCLQLLCLNDENRQAFMELGWEALINIWQLFHKAGDIVAPICSIVWALVADTEDSSLITSLIEAKCIDLMVLGLVEHAEDAVAICNICEAFTSVAMDDRCADLLQHNSFNVDGLQGLAAALQKHLIDTPDDKSGVCLTECIVELCYHESLKQSLVEHNFVEALVRIRRAHKDKNPTLFSNCEQALTLLAS